MTARERLAQAPPSAVCELDPAKAARFKAKTMLIPSPLQVRGAIAAVPAGSAVTLKTLRERLARESGADVTCPYAAGVGWRLVAEAAEEDRAEGADEVTPWWRITKDGKAYAKLPGGDDNHRRLLAEEGIAL